MKQRRAVVRHATGIGALVAIAMTVGCADSRVPAGSPVPNAPLPTIAERTWVTDFDASPQGLNTPITLSESGLVGFVSRLSSGKQLVVLDSLGAVVEELGPQGSGPGEVHSPLPFYLDDSVFKVVDLSGLVVTTWSLDSGTVRTKQLVKPILPQAELSGRWLGLDVTEAGFVPMFAHEATDIEWNPVPSSSSLVDSILHEAQARKTRPGVALWDGGFIVADGFSYRVAVVDHDGMLLQRHSRALEPNLPGEDQVERELARLRAMTRDGSPRYDQVRLAQIADSLRTTPRAWFAPIPPAGIDGAGRLWVLGALRDSVFADVFDAAGFIGRHNIPCSGFRGRWVVKDHWLALLCAPRDSTLPVDAEARLYRIGG